MRVLHLLSPADMEESCDAQVLGCLGAMAHLREAQHEALVVGGGEERAWAMGLPSEMRIGAQSGSVPALRRVIRARGPFDVVHAWSGALERLARRSVREARVTATPMQRPGAALVAGAAPPDEPTRRAARRTLGVGEDEVVVLIVADPPRRLEAVWAVSIQYMVERLGGNVTLVLPGGAAGAARGVNLHRSLGVRGRLVVCDAPLVVQALGADGAVLAPGAVDRAVASQVLALHMMGVPVVARADAAAMGAHPAIGREELLSQSRHPAGLARPLAALARRPRRLRTLARAVRAPAREASAALAAELREAWGARAPVAGT